MASVLVQAAANKITTQHNKPIRSPLHSINRKQYRTTFTFVFNIETKEYYLVDKEPLQEQDPYK